MLSEAEKKEIEVDPANIPGRVELDVTNMMIGDSLHVSDIKLPEGVEILDDPETSVAVLAAPRAVIEEAPAAEAVEGALEAAAEPEVIGKGPTEEEEGEGGGGEPPGKK